MQNVSVSKDQWTDMNAVVYNTPVSDFITIQNKLVDKVIVYVGETPSDIVDPIYDGVILNPEDTKTFNLTEGLWIRSTNRSGFISVFNPIDIGESPTLLPQDHRPLDFENKQAMHTVFGETITASHTDSINVQFQYNVSSWNTNQVVSGTGTIAHNSASMAMVSSGVGICNSELSSIDSVRYVAGKEMFANFTAMFINPQSGVDQFIGMIDAVDGFAVGYKSGVFGMLHRVNSVETFIPESSFNMYNQGINKTGINIYKISYGWLGVAPAILSVYQGFDKGWKALHAIDYTGQQTPHLTNPSLPITVYVKRLTGSGTNAQIATSSWRAGIVGVNPAGSDADRVFPIVVKKTITANTLTPLVTIKNKATFQSHTNHVKARYGTIAISSDGAKSVVITVYKGGTLVGGTYVDYDTALSTCQYNITATSFTPTNVNKLQGGTVLGKVDNTRINLFANDVKIYVRPNEILTLCAESPNASDITLFVRHIEEF